MRGAKPAQVTECSLGYVKEEAALQNMLLSCLHYECTVGPIYDFRSLQVTGIFRMFIFFYTCNLPMEIVCLIQSETCVII